MTEENTNSGMLAYATQSNYSSFKSVDKYTDDETEDTLKSASDNDDTQKTESSKDTSEDWETRYKNLQSFKDKRINSLESQIEDLQKQINTAKDGPRELPVTEEELTAFAEQYPQAYNRMLAIVKKELINSSKEMKDEFEAIKKQSLEVEKNKVKLKLQEAHPELDLDLIDSGQDEKFVSWFNAQPEMIQLLITKSGKYDDLNYALKLYKNDAGITKKSKPDPASSVATKTKASPGENQKKIWSRQEIKKLTISQFEKHEKEIDEAVREGRIVD